MKKIYTYVHTVQKPEIEGKTRPTFISIATFFMVGNAAYQLAFCQPYAFDSEFQHCAPTFRFQQLKQINKRMRSEKQEGE